MDRVRSGQKGRVTTKVPKVRAWSNSVRKEDFNAADLDLFVLRDHQPILAALGRERADEATPVDKEPPPAPEPRWLRPYRYLSTFAPVFTIAAFGGRAPGSGIESDGMDSDWAVPYLALLWLLAVAGPWFVARRWWAADRHWEPMEVIYGLATALFAAAALRGLAQEWGQGWLGLATLPVWVTGLGAALFLVAVLVGSRGRRSTADVHFVRVGEPDPTRARQMIDALPARMREQLHDMRRRAVDTLRKRGLVDDDEASRLLSTLLGEGPLPRH